jgi:hypothetical protein
MAQILASDYEMELPYSTLTRWVRQAELRAAPKRSGEYHFAPGEEMQHDTSPHRVMLGGKAVPLQCAALTLAYSRRLYVRYYLRYSRLEALETVFLHRDQPPARANLCRPGRLERAGAALVHRHRKRFPFILHSFVCH